MLYSEDIDELRAQLYHLLDNTTLDESQYDELTYRLSKLDELINGMVEYNAENYR